ncbi:MAG: preprotein translocase subunit YajC [Dehalococcoidia bacterium]
MNTEEIGFIIILGVLVAIYLTFIRPSQQEQKRLQGLIQDIHVGDEVITTAGFFGVVKEIHTPEEGPVQIVIDFGSGVQVRALTSSILRRVSVAPESIEQPEEVKGA